MAEIIKNFNTYSLKNFQSFILGLLTPIVIMLLFYSTSIYIDGVNENYFKIFCQIKSKDAAN